MIFHDLFEDFRNNVSRYQRGLRNFELSVESNSGLLLFFLTLLCDWPRELGPYSQPIGCKTMNNRHLIICVFPRFMQFAYFILSSHWPMIM